MKALIGKELRENFKIGLIGFVIFILVVLGVGLSYSRFIDAIALGKRAAGNNWNSLQPLTSTTFLMAAVCCCGVFGALLGWLQIHHEKQRDLWAFLIHRPVARTRIFGGKVVAGLTLYTLGAGLPLFCFVLWVRMPGHVAAPFEWAMAWPWAVSFLLGIVWYFAGMLTRLREARWYASRALCLGVGVVATGAALMPWLWWVLVGCGILLGLAVWGGFYNHGHYDHQPAPGKIALTASITLGATVLISFAAILITSVFPGIFANEPWSSYVMTYDGIVGKQTYREGGQWQIVDLQGRPLNNSPNEQAGGILLPVDRGEKSHQLIPLLFAYWGSTVDTIWFYWTRHGRLVGFNLATRRLAGSLGPDGFSTGLPKTGSRFETQSTLYPLVLSRRTLHTATGVYEVRVDDRTVRSFFATVSDDPIRATGDVVIPGQGLHRTAVVTRRSVQLLAPEGTTIFRISFEQPRPDYTDVRLFILGPSGHFALWVGPSPQADMKNPGKLPIHITWFRDDEEITKRAELPPLRQANLGNAPRDKFMSAVMPSAIMFALPLLIDQPIPWKFVTVSLAAALLIFVPAGVWLGRRYSFSPGVQIGWACFHLLGGLPGFVAFLSVHEWPPRERCVNCRKLRLVNRQRCEHCAAEFPPPAKDGTEIFDSLLPNAAK